MVHQLSNGYLFQSHATTIGQVSTHDVDVSSNSGTSKLDIAGLWSNTNTVTINYTCKRLDTQVNGTIYYTFEGNFIDTQNITHTIEGHICVLIDEVR